MSHGTDIPITGARKDIDVKIRFYKETNDRILEYCKSNGITRAETIRKSVNLFLSETEKKKGRKHPYPKCGLCYTKKAEKSYLKFIIN